jgi:hypothetical protein
VPRGRKSVSFPHGPQHVHSYESFERIAPPTSPVEVDAQGAVEDLGANGAVVDLEAQQPRRPRRPLQLQAAPTGFDDCTCTDEQILLFALFIAVLVITFMFVYWNYVLGHF